jgi:hypothetical protein
MVRVPNDLKARLKTEGHVSLRGAPSTGLRAGSGDGAISFPAKDCFAEIILSGTE